jgi:hypothetical protein
MEHRRGTVKRSLAALRSGRKRGVLPERPYGRRRGLSELRLPSAMALLLCRCSTGTAARGTPRDPGVESAQRKSEQQSFTRPRLAVADDMREGHRRQAGSRPWIGSPQTERIQSRGPRCRLVAGGTSGGRRAFESPPCEGGVLEKWLRWSEFELEESFSLPMSASQVNSRSLGATERFGSSAQDTRIG